MYTCMPAVLTMGILFAVLAFKFSAAYFSYAIAAFVFFLFWDMVKNHSIKILEFPWKKFSLILSGILLFYGALLLSSLIQRNRGGFLVGLDYFWSVSPLVIVFLVFNACRADEGVKWGLLIGSMLDCATGIMQWYMKPGMRITSMHSHTNEFGTILAMTIPFIVYYLVKEENKFFRLVEGCVLCMQIFCLYQTGSRGSVASLAAGSVLAVVVLIFAFRKNFSVKKWIALFVTVGIFAAVCLGGIYVIHEERIGMDKAGGERFMMIESSLRMWEDHKIAGIGLNRWKDNYYGEYRPEKAVEENLAMAHNMPIHFLATAGLIGFAGYSAFFLFVFAGLYKEVKRSKDFYFMMALLTVYFGFFIHGLVDATFVNKVSCRIFFALLGYGIMAETAGIMHRAGADEEQAARL